MKADRPHLEIDLWLRTLELPQYQAVFGRFDGVEDLITFTGRELIDLGITNVTHRTRIATSLAILKEKYKKAVYRKSIDFDTRGGHRFHHALSIPPPLSSTVSDSEAASATSTATIVIGPPHLNNDNNKMLISTNNKLLLTDCSQQQQRQQQQMTINGSPSSQQTTIKSNATIKTRPSAPPAGSNSNFSSYGSATVLLDRNNSNSNNNNYNVENGFIDDNKTIQQHCAAPTASFQKFSSGTGGPSRLFPLTNNTILSSTKPRDASKHPFPLSNNGNDASKTAPPGSSAATNTNTAAKLSMIENELNNLAAGGKAAHLLSTSYGPGAMNNNNRNDSLSCTTSTPTTSFSSSSLASSPSNLSSNSSSTNGSSCCPSGGEPLYSATKSAQSSSPTTRKRLKLDDQKWYHGRISRIEAQNALKIHGEFLVRSCISSPGDHVLSVSWHGKTLHFMINRIEVPISRAVTKRKNSESSGKNISKESSAADEMDDSLDEIYDLTPDRRRKYVYQFEEEQFESIVDLIEFHRTHSKPITVASRCVINLPAFRKASSPITNVVESTADNGRSKEATTLFPNDMKIIDDCELQGAYVTMNRQRPSYFPLTSSPASSVPVVPLAQRGNRPVRSDVPLVLPPALARRPLPTPPLSPSLLHLSNNNSTGGSYQTTTKSAPKLRERVLIKQASISKANSESTLPEMSSFSSAISSTYGREDMRSSVINKEQQKDINPKSNSHIDLSTSSANERDRTFGFLSKPPPNKPTRAPSFNRGGPNGRRPTVIIRRKDGNFQEIPAASPKNNNGVIKPVPNDSQQRMKGGSDGGSPDEDYCDIDYAEMDDGYDDQIDSGITCNELDSGTTNNGCSRLLLYDVPMQQDHPSKFRPGVVGNKPPPNIISSKSPPKLPPRNNDNNTVERDSACVPDFSLYDSPLAIIAEAGAVKAAADTNDMIKKPNQSLAEAPNVIRPKCLPEITSQLQTAEFWPRIRECLRWSTSSMPIKAAGDELKPLDNQLESLVYPVLKRASAKQLAERITLEDARLLGISSFCSEPSPDVFETATKSTNEFDDYDIVTSCSSSTLRNPQNVFELLLLPDGKLLRNDLMQRSDALRLFIVTSIVRGGTTKGERMALLSKWIQIAEQLRHQIRNLYGFGNVMAALQSDQIQHLKSVWSQLSAENNSLLMLLERTQRVEYRQLWSAESASSVNLATATVPFIQPILYLLDCAGHNGQQRQLGVIKHHPLCTLEEQGLDSLWYLLNSSRQWTLHLADFRRNLSTISNIQQQQQQQQQRPGTWENQNKSSVSSRHQSDQQQEIQLKELVKTELHQHLLWGYRSSTSTSTTSPSTEYMQKLDKFEHILNVIAEKAELNQ